jgi:hypothetical protein
LTSQARQDCDFTYEGGVANPILNTTGGPFGGPAQADPLAIWRILCRGPLDFATLNSYTPLPLTPIAGSPVPSQDGDHMVIWATPYTGDVFAQPGTLLDVSTQNELAAFVSAGGRLLVTGQDVGWALTKNGVQTSPFLLNTLHASFVTDAPQDVIDSGITGTFIGGQRNDMTAVQGQSATEQALFQFPQNPIDTSMTGRWGGYFGPYHTTDAMSPLRLDGAEHYFGHEGCPNAWFLDDIAPANGGLATYNYSNGGQSAMVRYLDPASGGRTLYCAFGLESLLGDWYEYQQSPNVWWIVSLEHRVRVLTNISDYFRTGGLTGKVVGRDGVTPQGGITVIARRGLTATGTILGQATTLQDGTYLIKGLTVGDYSLFVVSNLYTADHQPTQRVYGGQVTQSPDLNMALLLLSSGTIYGTVTDPTGKPVTGATVTATLATTGSTPYTVNTTTDINGQYTLTVPGGTYNVTATAAGFASASQANVVVVAGAGTLLNLKLGASPGTLTGTISGLTSAGSTQPLSGATVAANVSGVIQATTQTNGNGVYTLSLAAGTFGLTVTDPGYQQGTASNITVTSNQTTTENLTLTSVPPGTLEGLISLQGSTTPVGGVTVSLLAGGGTVATTTSTATATTDANGTWNYQFPNIPAGIYNVQTTATGYAAQTDSNVTVSSNAVTSGINFSLQPLHVFVAGLSMASTPFDYSTVAPDAGNLLLPSAPSTLLMAGYDAAQQAYDYYSKGSPNPSGLAKTFVLGRGYFLKLSQNVPLTVQGTAAPTTGAGFNLGIEDLAGDPLPAGWNLIGCPYPFSVDFQACSVIYNGQTYTMANAVSQGLVNGALYTLNFGAYQEVYEFDPYTSYWLLCYQPVTLVVPPTPLTRAATAPPVRAAATAASWQAQLLARTADGRNAHATFGVSPSGGATYSALDRVEPPAPPTTGWLRMAFPETNWGRFSARYTTDVRGPARQLTWNLEVNSDQGGDKVTLSWPALGAALPVGVNVVLQDVENGVSRNLRYASSYDVTVGPSGTYKLALVVTPESGRTQIGALSFVSTRGASAEARFTLTGAAAVDLVVRGLGGTVVRRVASGDALEAGPHVYIWDGRDDNGRAVPDGTYRLELTGTDNTGALSRAVTTAVLRR